MERLLRHRSCISTALMVLVVMVTIRYVDGYQKTFPASQWRYERPEGVDWVRVCNPKCDTIHTMSVYWLYKEGDDWVAGGGPIGYGKLSPEVILKPDGTQEARPIRFAPDLKLDQVKLGWWWPGTRDKPINDTQKGNLDD